MYIPVIIRDISTWHSAGLVYLVCFLLVDRGTLGGRKLWLRIGDDSETNRNVQIGYYNIGCQNCVLRFSVRSRFNSGLYVIKRWPNSCSVTTTLLLQIYYSHMLREEGVDQLYEGRTESHEQQFFL